MIAAMLNYDMPLWRPPSEGNNLIIQATIGCSFNRCSFCSMYRTKTFQARPSAQVFADIEVAARMWPDAHRVFLADGDALVLPTEALLAILHKLAASFPNLARVSSYALPANLIKKSVDEPAALKRAKLTLLYYGLESGDADILKRVSKGASPRAIITGLGKARDAGLKVSAMIILGLGGRNHWRAHIVGTAAVVNETAPTYLSTLQLGLDPMIKDEFLQRFGEPFEPQDDAGMLVEQQHLVAQLDPPTPVIFRSNHASNALPLAGTLPKDRDALLSALGAAQAGDIPLRPKHLRAH
jgi:coproporphyrinogen III oxidase-like Fe-S oxidoreductase